MRSQAGPSGHDEYVLGRTSEEYRRLRSQAQLWEDSTRRLLQQVGLQQSMNCLDIGCGPGEAMRLMGEIVGPSGRVTGVDQDGRLGREAVELLRATTKSQFSFVEGDVTTMQEIPGQPFDVTFARLLLFHVPDPLVVLRRMYEWTKPGGFVVVQDYDVGKSAIYPELDAWAEFERVQDGVMAAAGRDVRIGYKVPVYFVEAGIGIPDGTDVSGIVTSLAQAGEMVQAVYRSLLPRALDLGITTQAKSEAFFEEMRRAPTERYYAGLLPLLIGTWKRKPN